MLLSSWCCFVIITAEDGQTPCDNEVIHLDSYPALFLLLLGVLVLQAAQTGHAGQTVETGDALTRVLTSNSQVCLKKKRERERDVKRGNCTETQARRAERQRRNKEISWEISKPFMFSGLFKAPCMTAWASSFLDLRVSMVSLNSINSES